MERILRKVQARLSKMGCVSTGLIKTTGVKELEKENPEAVKKENEKRRT